MIPPGCCECGCGARTEISRKTDRRFGYVEGKPRRYLKGHARRIHIAGMPVALCACGCGQPVQVAPYTKRQRGWLRGVPRAYRKGHHNPWRNKRPKGQPGAMQDPLSASWRVYLAAFDRVLYARETRIVVARCVDMARLATWNSIPVKAASRNRLAEDLDDLLPNRAAYRTVREHLPDQQTQP